MENKFIEFMDTTLRDGEQTSGVSFMPHEKLVIARALLTDLNVDRIEVASARVSAGEQEAVRRICRWANMADKLDCIEVLGFVDGHVSVDWIKEAGGKNINLLCKGSLRHCCEQLKKTPEEHIADIKEVISYADSQGVGVNVYLEDWSNGMKSSPEYVYQIVDALKETSVRRFMLPDTLGILNPLDILNYMALMMERYPDLHFDIHAHNDYDLAVANELTGAYAGCKGVHTSINGLGERAGNASLASMQAVLKDQLNVETHIDEKHLNEVSRLVEGCSGIPIPPNQPVVGDSVFTQVAGVHADGDKKADLYQNALMPERFGRKREYALGKNSGKANIQKNLEALGMELTPEQTKRVTDRIIELGDKKEIVTQDELPYIVNDVLKHAMPEEHVKLLSYVVTTAYGLKPITSLRLEVNGEIYEESAQGDGQFDSFMRAIRHIYRDKLSRKLPWLSNYVVTIPPGGRTDALVQTVITWTANDRIFRTRGLDADQTEAAIKASIKMLNLIEPYFRDEKGIIE